MEGNGYQANLEYRLTLTQGDTFIQVNFYWNNTAGGATPTHPITLNLKMVDDDSSVLDLENIGPYATISSPVIVRMADSTCTISFEGEEDPAPFNPASDVTPASGYFSSTGTLDSGSITMNLNDIYSPTIITPISGANYPKGASITSTWTIPVGETQTAYRIQVGLVGFSSIYEDTGKILSSVTSGVVSAPSYSGSVAIRVYYWNVDDTQSTASIPVTLTVTGGGTGGTDPVTPPAETDTDNDGLPDATDPDDDNDGIPDYQDPSPLVPGTEDPIVAPEIPDWVPPPVAEIIEKVYPGSSTAQAL